MSWVKNGYGASSGITEALDILAWEPASITYGGPARGMVPLDVHHRIYRWIPYDSGINSSNFVTLATHAGGRGVDSGGSTIPTGCSLINDEDPWTRRHARLDTAMKVHLAYNGAHHGGIICLASNTNIDEGGGSQAYALVYENVSFSQRWRLIHLTNGFSGPLGGSYGSTYVLLAQSAWNTSERGRIYNVSLEWEADSTLLYGVRLHARVKQGERIYGPKPPLAPPYIVDWHIVYTGTETREPWVPSGSVNGGAGMFIVATTAPSCFYFDSTAIYVPDIGPARAYYAAAPGVVVNRNLIQVENPSRGKYQANTPTIT